MKIRHATQDDGAQLTALLSEMGYAMSPEEMRLRIVAFTTGNHQLLVMEERGTIVGAIAFGCYEQFRIAGSCCHIDTLVVQKAFRGKGFGKQLMASAEQYAMAHGAKTIELITANYRREHGTHDFYKTLGYKDHTSLDYSYFAKENL